MFSNWSTMSEADEGDILDLLDRLIISVRKLSIQVNIAEEETCAVLENFSDTVLVGFKTYWKQTAAGFYIQPRLLQFYIRNQSICCRRLHISEFSLNYSLLYRSNCLDQSEGRFGTLPNVTFG